jgi:tetratricopeptide (TPR) repeat protein
MQQLFLFGIVAVLFIILFVAGYKTNTATYDKPIETPAMEGETMAKADIFGLLHRFAGENASIDSILHALEADSSNTAAIDALEKVGKNSRTDVFSAYALYLKGLKTNNLKDLQESADLFFTAGNNDPDTLADKITYSVYAKRACDIILLKDPKNKAALTRKGVCSVYFEGAVMEGVGLLKEVETLDSNYLEAQHHLMLLDLQSGQLEKAKKRIKKLLFLQPGNQQYADILLKLETNTLK